MNKNIALNINHRFCNICSSNDCNIIVDLGLHPLADSFPPQDDYSDEVFYPLYLLLCKACGHVFTGYKIDATTRYQTMPYSYDSSNSIISHNHFSDLANFVSTFEELGKEAKILDIGSNTGTFLLAMKKLGFHNLKGVEPAKNIAMLAKDRGIQTINAFFDTKTADQIRRESLYDVINSSNTFNHVDDLIEFVKNIDKILAPDGKIVFEVPYIKNIIQSISFDTIYHEHVNYFSVKSLKKLLNIFGFSIVYFKEICYMGGSIRIVAKKGQKESKHVQVIIKEEDEIGIFNEDTYIKFMIKVEKLKKNLLHFLYKSSLNGEKVIAIGAATKGNTLLNFCNINTNLITAVADTSNLKIGKRTPGSRLPIINEDNIENDVVTGVILAWNIADYLIKKLDYLNINFYVPTYIENEEND